MNILFLTTAHNSLSQRLLIELTERGHKITVSIADGEAAMLGAVARENPDLIIAPMLKAAIPEEIWSKRVCLIVHPGIMGDRGPSSLDWAIAEGAPRWGVTVLQAAAEMDAGPIWASHEFPLPQVADAKGSLYRNEVTEAAVKGVLEAVEKFESRRFRPVPLDYARPEMRGRLRPTMAQKDRAIDWARDRTDEVVRKLRAADSAPGVLDSIFGLPVFLYGAHNEDRLKGAPGAVIAQRDGAICRATVDGAVWITHLKLKREASHDADRRFAKQGYAYCDAEFRPISGIKLPATQILGPLMRGVPEAVLPVVAELDCRSYREIRYVERDGVGHIYFDFYNGAMSTEQCYRLRDAFLFARSRPTRVIVLQGGKDFFSNGIHLNVIEAADDPAVESWRNINAIDDVVYEILNTMSHIVVASLRGNAGAGGAILALAADKVFARDGVVFNPHYKGMGGLYGSEYWTYVLPRRVGAPRAQELTEACRPMGTDEAKRIGFVDGVFAGDVAGFERQVAAQAASIASRGDFWNLLRDKHERRVNDERAKPLAAYRAEELAKMKVNFFGPDAAYHRARENFVFKGRAPAAKADRSSAPERLSHAV
ncbi:hydrogenase maturation protein [Methylocystis parvus]|uniref:Hydrogenase maturation protein n=1 Tax=Methylocystis parvus TaxID=134 RepID=A0A6B8M492_9HYPH|nr:hydrogenase maturation protein [Methylocystis parvus]QGM96902.1 hydrogenase maturation protein [Methylocystis parvus]WBJ99214.1 hydrogenase maturation protein [Methylocystis parvus OBBP]